MKIWNTISPTSLSSADQYVSHPLVDQIAPLPYFQTNYNLNLGFSRRIILNSIFYCCRVVRVVLTINLYCEILLKQNVSYVYETN